MSVLVSDKKNEIIVDCNCGCQDAVHIRIDANKEFDSYAFLTYLNGNWYRDQDDQVLRCIGRKLRKIWAIIRNKDFYYSEVLMTQKEFETFKKYINQF